MIPWLTVWGTFLFLGGQTNQYLLKSFVTYIQASQHNDFFYLILVIGEK